MMLRVSENDGLTSHKLLLLLLLLLHNDDIVITTKLLNLSHA